MVVYIAYSNKKRVLCWIALALVLVAMSDTKSSGIVLGNMVLKHTFHLTHVVICTRPP